MKRPLFVIGCSFFLSTAAALLFGDNFAAAVGVLALLGAAAALFLVREGRVFAVLVLTSAALGMGMTLARDVLAVRPVLSLAGKSVYLTGRVERVDDYETSSAYRLDARVPLRDGRELHTAIRLYSRTPLSAEINDELHGYAALYRPDVSASARLRNAADGVFLYGTLEPGAPLRIVPREEARKDAGWRLAALRERLTALNRELLGRDAALVNAVLFGDKSALGDRVRLDFQRAGLLHLMAVSGFHLSLVTALLTAFLRALGLSRRSSALLALPGMLLFMGLSGFTPSVLRAGLMVGLLLVSTMLGERYDALSSLGFALTGVCLINPYDALSAGFLLSFSAAFGIVALSPGIAALLGRIAPAARGRRAPSRLLQALAVSLGAFAATLPVMVFLFDSVSLVGPLASLLGMPLATALLWCALPMTLLALIPGAYPAARVLAGAVRLLGRMLTALAGGFAGFPLAMAPIRYGYVRILAVLFCGSAALLWALRVPARQRRFCAALCAAVFAAGWLSAQWMGRNTLRVATFEGVDAAVAVDGREAFLIGFPSTYSGGYAVVNYMEAMGVETLRLAVGAAGDEDDSLGALPILKAFPPRNVVTTGQGRYAPHILSLSRGARLAPPPAEAAQTIRLGGVALTIEPCSCGRGVKIDAGGAGILKLRENCAIMDEDPTLAAVVRGWVFEDPPGGGRALAGGDMTSSFDGERTTTYILRKGGTGT